MAIKPDHNGAKNGGGLWGPRQDAKTMSNVVRRREDSNLVGFYASYPMDTPQEGHRVFSDPSRPDEVYPQWRYVEDGVWKVRHD